MASILDIGLFEHFGPLFVFLLVFVFVYGILLKTQPFGDQKSIYGVFALASAFLVLFVPNLTHFVTIAAPFFVVFAILIFLFLLGFMALGHSGDSLFDYIKTDKVSNWGIFVIGIFILMFVFSQVFGAGIADRGDGTSGEELENSIRDVLFHPKVLGVFFVLVISAFAVLLITQPARLG